jgi:hypothetical protein
MKGTYNTVTFFLCFDFTEGDITSDFNLLFES